MKNSIFIVLFMLLLSACNNKDESKNVQPEEYFKGVVGENVEGQYTITNLKAIKSAWEADAKFKLEDNSIELENFRIVKIKTEGDRVEDCYMLVANDKKGYVKLAAILKLNSNKFYFEDKQLGDSRAYRVVICVGSCESGCDPVVRIQNGDKREICSSCLDCQKIDSEMQ